MDILFCLIIFMSVTVTMHEVYHMVLMDEPHLICVGLSASGSPGAVFGYGVDKDAEKEEIQAHIFGASFGASVALLFVLREFMK